LALVEEGLEILSLAFFVAASVDLFAIDAVYAGYRVAFQGS
jgi:hypothetical protein